MPGESGMTLARELAARHAGPAVLMVSGEDDAEVAQIALDAGALGLRDQAVQAQRSGDRDPQRAPSATRGAGEPGEQTRLEERVIERSAVARDALERLRGANEETVLRLSKAVEYRDPETGSHIERMSHYCALLAASFGFDRGH